jgi:hypothetical protein
MTRPLPPEYWTTIGPVSSLNPRPSRQRSWPADEGGEAVADGRAVAVGSGVALGATATGAAVSAAVIVAGTGTVAVSVGGGGVGKGCWWVAVAATGLASTSGSVAEGAGCVSSTPSVAPGAQAPSPTSITIDMPIQSNRTAGEQRLPFMPRPYFATSGK